MLEVKSENVEALRRQRREAGYAALHARLAEPYRASALGRTARHAYDAWFDARLADCHRWRVYGAHDVGRLLHYHLVFAPGFPADPRYARCLRILEDARLAERAKVDKVNYQLLFLR